MSAQAVRDSGCDAFALLRSRLDVDTEAIQVILDGCDLRDVAEVLAVQYIALALRHFRTEEGARQHLAHLTDVWLGMPW